jgi:hypothetical protein
MATIPRKMDRVGKVGIKQRKCGRRTIRYCTKENSGKSGLLCKVQQACDLRSVGVARPRLFRSKRVINFKRLRVQLEELPVRDVTNGRMRGFSPYPPSIITIAPQIALTASRVAADRDSSSCDHKVNGREKLGWALGQSRPSTLC